MSVETILFLCPGNFVRSILAEAIMNKLGAGRFHAFSAGMHPHRCIHREVRHLLKERGFAVEGLASKPVELFIGPNAPHLDYVITLCEASQEKGCPSFAGQPQRARWSLRDPCQGTAKGATRQSIESAFRDIHMLIGLFLQAPDAVHRLLHLPDGHIPCIPDLHAA